MTLLETRIFTSYYSLAYLRYFSPLEIPITAAMIAF